jgi:hypothetical protein
MRRSPPAVGGLEGDRSVDRQITEDGQHGAHPIEHAAVHLHHAVVVDDGNLGPFAMHVDTDVDRH